MRPSPVRGWSEPAWRRLSCLWLLLSLLALALLGWQLSHSRINTSLMDLLPHEERSTLDPALRGGLLRQLDKQLVWMLSLPAGQDGRVVAEEWAKALSALPELSAVRGAQPELAPAWQGFIYDYAWQRLDEGSRARLAEGPEAWSQWVLGQIYSPFGGVSRPEWQADPLLLTRAGVQGQAATALRLDQGWLMSRDEAGRQWFLLRAELDLSAFDLSRNSELLARLNAAEQSLKAEYPGLELLRRGTLFYSQHASDLAQEDISTIGLGSTFGVLLLMWLAFRSGRALWISLLPIAIGLAWGVLAVLLWFGEVHLFTLVISSSLVGVIDYGIHFLTERRLHGDQESPHQTRARLLPSLSMALFATLVGYGLLWLAPFPGLQQMALCALVGLTASFITVLCLFPLWLGDLPQREARILVPMALWLKWWRESRALRWGVPLLWLILIGVGLNRLEVDDDIARLQPLPTELQAQERQIQHLTGQQGGMTGFLVTAADGETALQRLEAMSHKLAQARAQGQLAGFVSLAQWLPSQAQQRADHAALTRLLPEVVARLNQAGVPVEAKPRSWHPLTPEQWLASPVSEGSRLLWHGLPDGRVALWLPVNGVTEVAAVAKLAQGQEGVFWQDPRNQWSELFTHYRIKLTELLLVAIALVGLLLWVRFGWRKSVRILLISGFSLGAGLALLAACGQPLTLFGVLAMSLIFGIGIDYSLFFAYSGGDPLRQRSTMFAILLANLTTQLSFGLLALSHTSAIAGFGLVLSGGIFTAFLLSPLVLERR
ncbi:MMPL family transporter [Aeromonas encheleia]|uniref:MMPL family transporter n=1 Tax=Aeromonas encheleia TaxID=73010 RepID=A0AAE9MLK7_9GAMM|nr:MMPL family transporter [Aeromonas encheleia]USV59533.1 MMPL family transporter [Aeromonas encheleia]